MPEILTKEEILSRILYGDLSNLIALRQLRIYYSTSQAIYKYVRAETTDRLRELLDPAVIVA